MPSMKCFLFQFPTTETLPFIFYNWGTSNLLLTYPNLKWAIKHMFIKKDYCPLPIGGISSPIIVFYILIDTVLSSYVVKNNKVIQKLSAKVLISPIKYPTSVNILHEEFSPNIWKSFQCNLSQNQKVKFYLVYIPSTYAY